jgi:hypothetical protein
LSFSISRQGSATPGEYASDKSAWVLCGFVGLTSIFPGLPCEWYNKAASLVFLFIIYELKIKLIMGCKFKGIFMENVII